MINEITATKEELVNDLVSVSKTNIDLIKKISGLHSEVASLTRENVNIREAYALTRGEVKALKPIVRDFKKTASTPNYMKEAIASAREDNKKLREENKSLKQLLILHLRTKDLSYTKIADIMGVSITTVTSRFRFIKRELKKAEK
jgi:DNA-directed RNA polymerase specialized sigma24 family protein